MTLNLNCANFNDANKEKPNIPPEESRQHPVQVDKESIRRAIARGVETLVIKVADNKEIKRGEIRNKRWN